MRGTGGEAQVARFEGSGPARFVEPCSRRDERLWTSRRRASGSRGEEGSQALPHAERTAPTERAAAILASSPPVVLEDDAPRTADAANPGRGLLNSAMSAFVGDLCLEQLRGFLRVLRKRQARKIVALGEDVPGLSQERPDFGYAQIIRLRLFEDRFARAEDRLGLLDLRLSELHRSVDLPLLTFHGEPLGALQQVPGTAVLARGNRGLRGFVEFLRFPDIGAAIAGDRDVVRNGTDRLLDLT